MSGEVLVWQLLGMRPESPESLRFFSVGWVFGRGIENGRDKGKAMRSVVESWLPVPGYDGKYAVSDLGRVKNVRTRRLRKPVRRKKDGRLQLVLFQPRRKPKSFLVHRLVMLAFKGPPPSKLHQVNHENAVPTDNRLLNLAYCTKAENDAHARANRLWSKNRARGERHGRAKMTDGKVRAMRSLADMGASITFLAKTFHLSVSQTHDIVAGRSWKHLL